MTPWQQQWPKWTAVVSKFLVAIVFFFVGMNASAQNHNINTVQGLSSACNNVIKDQKGEPFDERAYGLCYGYIRGIKNTYDIQKIASGDNFNGKICYPDNVTWLQLIKVYVAWVDNHPEALHKTAWLGMVGAYKAAFPCRD